MFLFEQLSLYSGLMFFGVIIGLIILNELTRASKWFSVFMFILLPIVLTFTVWNKTAGSDSSTGTWFHWIKVYSALAGCIGFMAFRYIKNWDKVKFLIIFPALILSINIIEAVIRDFQVYQLYKNDLYGTVVNMVTMKGGGWNILNGIAGIINIITISGFLGVFVDKKSKKKDMIWPDMLWFWIIAYDLWNFAYVYNCVSDHAFYAGAALLISCTIPAFFIKKGAWLQHRAQTLAFWMMFTMSIPQFTDTSIFAVKSSHNETALWTVSIIALIANIFVLIYHIYKIYKTKRNPLKEDLYIDLPQYQEIAKLKES